MKLRLTALHPPTCNDCSREVHERYISLEALHSRLSSIPPLVVHPAVAADLYLSEGEELCLIDGRPLSERALACIARFAFGRADKAFLTLAAAAAAPQLARSQRPLRQHRWQTCVRLLNEWLADRPKRRCYLTEDPRNGHIVYVSSYEPQPTSPADTVSRLALWAKEEGYTFHSAIMADRVGWIRYWKDEVCAEAPCSRLLAGWHFRLPEISIPHRVPEFQPLPAAFAALRLCSGFVSATTHRATHGCLLWLWGEDISSDELPRGRERMATAYRGLQEALSAYCAGNPHERAYGKEDWDLLLRELRRLGWPLTARNVQSMVYEQADSLTDLASPCSEASAWESLLHGAVSSNDLWAAERFAAAAGFFVRRNYGVVVDP